MVSLQQQTTLKATVVEVVLVRKERTLYGTVVAMVETVYQVLSLEVQYSVQEAEVEEEITPLTGTEMVVQVVVAEAVAEAVAVVRGVAISHCISW